MPGESMGMISQLMPLCFGASGFGPHEELAAVGDLGVGGPDLLAGDHVVVAVAHGPGAQRGEVGPGLGLGEPLAPHVVAAQDAGQVRAPAAPRCPRR